MLVNISLIFAQKIKTMNFPENLKYTKDHEWVLLEGDTATVGITDFAQRELGDIVYIEIETVGQELGSQDIFGSVEAVKTVSDLYLPAAGTIMEVNPELASNPEYVNQDPYGKGWMIKVKVSDLAEIEGLMDAKAYAELVG